MAITKIKRLLELDGSELGVLARAWTWLLISRLTLRWMRFSTVDRLIASNIATHRRDRPTPERIAYLVRAAASHHLCTMRCLPRALTLRRLLAQRGFPALLRIGVEPDRAPELAAHAWVEIDGEQVGEPTDALERYRAFPPLAGASSGSTSS